MQTPRQKMIRWTFQKKKRETANRVRTSYGKQGAAGERTIPPCVREIVGTHR
jgi:hypothetical protein